jgi:hypothetical protein
MGATVLQALAQQRHPADPTRLQTHRQAAGAHPRAQKLDVSGRAGWVDIGATVTERGIAGLAAATVGVASKGRR